MHRTVPHQFPWLRRPPFWWCAVLLVLLAACASATTPTTTPSSPNPAQPPAPQITTLTVWHSWSGAQADALNVMARQYEQANPTVRIRLEVQPAATLLRTFSARVDDASAPQVVITPGRYLGQLTQRQFLMPLDQGAFALKDLLPAAVDNGRVGGQLFGVPLAWDALVLFYDRRALPNAPTSFEALLAAKPTIPVSDTAHWNAGYYLSLDRTLPYASVWNGTLLDNNGQPTFATSSRDATIGWLRWLRSLYTNPAILATPDFSALDQRLQEGRVLSMIDWAHKRPDYEQLWQGANTVGIAPLPTLQGKPPRPLVQAEVGTINAVTSDAQRHAAIAFLRYATDAPAQTLLAKQSHGAVLPVHTGVQVDNSSAAVRVALGQAQSFTSALNAAWQPLDAMVNSVVNGGDAAAAVDKASTQIGNK